MELTTIKQTVEVKKTCDRAVVLPLYYKTTLGSMTSITRVSVEKATGELVQTLVETTPRGWVHLSSTLPFKEMPIDAEDSTSDEFQSILDRVITQIENVITSIEKEG